VAASATAGGLKRAPRYHTGGIAGFAPEEVPAILRRGEAVLTPGQMKALGAGIGSREDRRPPMTVVMNITTPRLQQLPPQPGPDRRRGGAGPRAGTARFLSRCPSPDPRSCKSFVRTAKLSKITAKLGRLNASMH
jgi:hypothetical protein